MTTVLLQVIGAVLFAKVRFESEYGSDYHLIMADELIFWDITVDRAGVDHDCSDELARNDHVSDCACTHTDEVPIDVLLNDVVHCEGSDNS